MASKLLIKKRQSIRITHSPIMKKRTLLLLFTILSFSYSKAQSNSKHVASHKTGTYAYEGEFSEFRIKRTKNKQIEYSITDKSKQVIMKVQWKSSTEYWLTAKKIKNMPSCIKVGDVIKVQITSGNAKSYQCIYSSEKCGEGSSKFIKL